MKRYSSSLESLPPLNSDQAIDKVGPAGLYQIIAGLILTLTFALSGQFVYSLAYLQDRHNITIICHFASGNVGQCTMEQACNTDVTKSYSFDTQHSLTNFITEVPQLLCTSGTSLSL